jgi:hypothetical protein
MIAQVGRRFCSRPLLTLLSSILLAALAGPALLTGCAGGEEPPEEEWTPDAGSDAMSEDVEAECSSNADCPGNCYQGSCLEPTCNDGEANGEETAVDCGGPECSACSVGQACQSGEDCQSGVCDDGQVCAAGSCTDGVENGTETDVDCGGDDCDGCPSGSACSEGTDCASGLCEEGQCVESRCDDGRKGGEETDIDCGGGRCSACKPGKDCGADADCTSGVCTEGSCRAGTCDDGVQNGNEADVDCGGDDSTCEPCANQSNCSSGDECASGVCDGGTCKAVTCMDGVANGEETDVDCGGPDCPACAASEKCGEDADCKTGICASGVCEMATCMDGSANGQETDVDCGGPTCPGCAAGKSCVSDSDCQSALSCDQSAGLCASNNAASAQFTAASSSKAVAPKSSSIDVTTNFTFEAWIKPTSGSGNRNIFGRQNSAYRWRLVSSRGSDAGKVWLLLDYASGSYSTYESASTVPLNTWTHVAVTFDSSTGQIQFLINGSVDKTVSGKSSPVSVSGWANLEIGFYGATNSEHFDGAMDELRMWDVTRTPAEIKSNMNKPLTGSETGLVGYWNAEGMMSSTLTDQTSNGNDASTTSVTFSSDTPF